MPDTLTDERLAVLDVLSSADGRMGPKDVHEAIPESSYGSIKNMLPSLAEDGYLVKEGHGKYRFVTDDPDRAALIKRDRALGDSSGGEPLPTGSVTDMLDDPERRSGAGSLVRAGGGVVAEGYDADGLMYAVRVDLYVRPTARRTDHSVRYGS